MKRRQAIRWIVVLIVALVVGSQPAGATVINFDGLSDLDSVTTQLPGLTFTNTTVLKAGFSLNEFDFPPHSGTNVVVDDGGPISVVFDTLQVSVGGFFTYATGLTFTAFDASNGVVGMDTSDFTTNTGTGGDPGSSPNELLTVAFTGGIKNVTIEGDPAGGSFTLDNLTFTNASAPAPATGFLLGLGLAALVVSQHVRRRRNHFP